MQAVKGRSLMTALNTCGSVMHAVLSQACDRLSQNMCHLKELGPEVLLCDSELQFFSEASS